ncbi:MAG: DUF2974 domain-containing protein [Peptococcaceae bacterium]
MANLFDYLEWRGDLTFSQAPFNPVDNLILSCLGYVVLDGLVSGFDCEEPATVEETARLFVQLPESVKKLRDHKDEKLLEKMGQSRRFGKLPLLYHVDLMDCAAEKQFAAITIALEDGSHYVAYRGTDLSVTGWKEDFNMTFRSGVPAQLEAVHYLQQVAQKTEGPLYVGGHSKGGNLAIYAAAFADDAVQQRIVAVYNNDGPGFLEDVIAHTGYQAVYARIQTFIPQTSLFGMMLEHAEPFTIIESSGHFILQHDPYSWNVLGPDFVYLEQVTASGRFLDATMRGWLAGLSVSQREQFVDALFDILHTGEAATLQDLARIWLTNTGDVWKTLRDVDDETAEMIRRTLRLLVQNMGHSVQELLLEEHGERMQPLLDMKEKLEQRSKKHRWLKLPERQQKLEKQTRHHVIHHRT